MTYYAIRVHGHLDDSWGAWFEDLHLSRLADGDTLLTGPLRDQAALHGVLARVRDLGLPLIAVASIAETEDEEAVDGPASPGCGCRGWRPRGRATPPP